MAIVLQNLPQVLFAVFPGFIKNLVLGGLAPGQAFSDQTWWLFRLGWLAGQGAGWLGWLAGWLGRGLVGWPAGWAGWLGGYPSKNLTLASHLYTQHTETAFYVVLTRIPSFFPGKL